LIAAADICVVYHAYWLGLWPEFQAVMRKFPRVEAYIERVSNRPAAAQVGAFSYEG
jgi:glutathione S-transferase